MTQKHDFQSIIMTLQSFWAELGCLIWQPYYSQVGAGTMNPATFLRVLGPEPWNVAYVEPSIRPDDGRYGQNPNRMQQHYQFQVILKPDPGDPQEIYLDSLQAIGIDPQKHDIRFVEDNWEQPAVGAWGLGWEVWLDGQEITQFTYMQQAGGINLDPVSVEITYGLDRIAIALQRVQGFQDIRWNTIQEGGRFPQRNLTAGDINLQAEQEHSKYYFEVADIDHLLDMYELFEIEAVNALKQGLVLPAYDYLLKCSHTFNVLDTRGAIGVTERQAYFGRMRDLSREISEAYLEGRQRLEYPWLEESVGVPVGVKASESHRKTTAASRMEATKEGQFLLEIGTEELPTADLDRALQLLNERFPVLLDDLRLTYGEMRVMGTPRRLVVSVGDLASRQDDQEEVVKGPPAERAFDDQGQPTPAAQGFARSKGVHVADLEVRELNGGQYAVAITRSVGRSTIDVLAEKLPQLIASLRFDKTMRWNSSSVLFSRPIRWLVALFDDKMVPFEYAELSSANTTRGLRFVQSEQIEVRTPGEYFATLSDQGIILDGEERRVRISEQIEKLASEIKGSAVVNPDLLQEVTNLVEAPLGVRGSFDADHLDLPREVLISVMTKHQRYFPVEKNGSLLPNFIAITNRGEADRTQQMDVVVEGNEHVIRARFADADFFVSEDMKAPLESYLPQLDTLIFQTDLGSMLDKTRRMRDLLVDLAPQLGLDEDQLRVSQRAVELCKADLVTHMVVEMTSLQGIMGRHYALNSGEPEPVADAIFEHYLPRYAGDILPETLPGLAVGLADRLDTLAGLFAVGLAPTGAKDPYGQRRAALGVVGNLIAWEIEFDLRSAIKAAAKRLPQEMDLEGQETCLRFIIERLRNLLLESGYRYDVVDAVLTAQGYNPTSAARAVKGLSVWIKREDWRTILPAYARCVRITRDLSELYPLNPEIFNETAEEELYRTLIIAESEHRQPGSVDDFLDAFLPMIPSIDRFFEEVLVMTEDPAIQHNRLGLLQRIAALAEGVADLSKLEGF